MTTEPKTQNISNTVPKEPQVPIGNVRGKSAKKKESGLLSSGGLSSTLKMVKMIQPKCRTCNPQGQGKRGWWDKCTHDPYFSMVPAGPPTPKYEELEDGTFKQVGVVEQRLVHQPNWNQVADDAKVISGRAVRIMLERGYKFPEDLDYAPICDYMNCWESNPSIHITKTIEHEGVQTVVGNYHTRDEAAIMTLHMQSVPIFVGVDHDINRRKQQLDQVNLNA